MCRDGSLSSYFVCARARRNPRKGCPVKIPDSPTRHPREGIKCGPGVIRDVDALERIRKKVREAVLLAGVEPVESPRLGFSLTRFARRLSEAADRARA